MTEQEAEAQGLSFTGIYNSWKEETKKRIAQERKERPKARILLVRTSSRTLSGIAIGWSAYADKKYFAYGTLERLGDVDAKHLSRLQAIKDKYTADCTQADECHERELAAKREAEALLAE